MSVQKLHVIAFQNPYPPRYGGLIDVFYKLKALHEIGFEIYLHFFTTDNSAIHDDLHAVVSKIFVYPSQSNKLLHLLPLPFSVISRNHPQLLENLKMTVAPILFESYRTTFLVAKDCLPNHRKFLRMHNIEHDYFWGIASSEPAVLRKLAYYLEGFKYKGYQKVLNKFDHILTLSHADQEYTKNRVDHTTFMPVFHGNDAVISLDGFGEFCLFHGDLSIADNRKSLIFVANVFKQNPDWQLVIAASTNEVFVQKIIGKAQNIRFENLLDFDHLKSLLARAHINISWSFQQSGTKLKVINCLYNSRFSIINENIVDDPAIENLCHVVTNETELTNKIRLLNATAFNEFENRKQVLELNLSNQKSVEKLKQIILGL